MARAIDLSVNDICFPRASYTRSLLFFFETSSDDFLQDVDYYLCDYIEASNLEALEAYMHMLH